MKLLAIETSTEACSAALYLDGHYLVDFKIAPRQHTELILPMCQQLLSQAEQKLSGLDAIAFGCGPGAFTGVRIAVSIAQGLAFAADLPVIPISSLAAIAQGIHRQHGEKRIVSAFDARMDEVYWAVYECNDKPLAQLVGSEIVINPNQTPALPNQSFVGVGSGWDRYATIFEEKYNNQLEIWYKQCFPNAMDIATLGIDLFKQGKFINPEHAVPSYVRNEVVRKK